MFKHVNLFILSWLGYFKLSKLSATDLKFVFYSEGRAYHGFLLPVITSLINNYDVKVYYLTSDPNDSLIKNPSHNIIPIYIGWGSAMLMAFQTLKACTLTMTMRDLNSFHIKRSQYPVHYIYLQHSIVSSHMVYRAGAFDHFDSILCPGPHQVAEIREWESLNSLPAKDLYEHGYAPLNTIIEASQSQNIATHQQSKIYHVLVAPSWGPEGVIEKGAEPLIKSLLDAGHYVTLVCIPKAE